MPDPAAGREAPAEEEAAIEETAAQWAERREREDAPIKIGCGAVIGLFVGVLLLAKFGLLHGTHWPVQVGVLIVVVALFAWFAIRKPEDELRQAFEAILFPEWLDVDRIPLWVWLVVLGVMLFAIAVGVVMLATALLTA